MQISISGNAIHLSRYGGTVTENGARKTLSVRVGSFPTNVKAEFNQSATEADEGSIPYQIYRATTPDEQQQIIDFMRNRQLAEVTRRVTEVTAELTTLTPLLAEIRIEEHDAQALRLACAASIDALRGSTPKKKPRAPVIAAQKGLGDSPASPPLPKEPETTPS